MGFLDTYLHLYGQARKVVRTHTDRGDIPMDEAGIRRRPRTVTIRVRNGLLRAGDTLVTHENLPAETRSTILEITRRRLVVATPYLDVLIVTPAGVHHAVLRGLGHSDVLFGHVA